MLEVEIVNFKKIKDENVKLVKVFKVLFSNIEKNNEFFD